MLDCYMAPPLSVPQDFTIACGDGNEVAVEVVWVRWGNTSAVGYGVDSWNSCVPYCAASRTWYKTRAVGGHEMLPGGGQVTARWWPT
jgi:hypothetical protein